MNFIVGFYRYYEFNLLAALGIPYWYGKVGYKSSKQTNKQRTLPIVWGKVGGWPSTRRSSWMWRQGQLCNYGREKGTFCTGVQNLSLQSQLLHSNEQIVSCVGPPKGEQWQSSAKWASRGREFHNWGTTAKGARHLNLFGQQGYQKGLPRRTQGRGRMTDRQTDRQRQISEFFKSYEF